MSAAPLLMLPVRLETSLTEDADSTLVVDIRIYPDQIHVDSARATLNPEEAAALDELARAESEGPAAFAAARRRIAAAFGKGRMDRLWQFRREGTLPPVSEKDWSEPPVARCLPERFVAIVRTSDGTERRVRGERLPDAVPMAPAGGDAQAFSGEPDDPLLWMSDFEKARSIGLAIRVPFEDGIDFSKIVSVEAIGIPREAPEKDRERFARLIEAQHDTVGVAVHPAGRPTKSGDPPLRFHSEQRGITAEGALALKPGALAEEDQRADGNAATEPCARLVWAAAMEPAVLQGWHLEAGEERTSADWVEALERRFVERLRPEGPFPVLSVGRQPYGIHVMSPAAERSQDAIAAAVAKIVPGLADAAEDRREALGQSEGDWSAILDHLTRPDQGGAWRRRRLHPLLAWVNLLLNTDGTANQELFRALDRRQEKLSSVGVMGIGQNRAGLSVAGDKTARLIDMPLVAPDAERSDELLASADIDALLASPLTVLFWKTRESNLSSILHLLALSALRWGIIGYAAMRETSGDRNAAFRLLGFGMDYNPDPSSWNKLIQKAFGDDAEQVSIADLLAATPPRSDGERRSARSLEALMDALRKMQDLPKWQVHRALAGAIDAASFRFDAWETDHAMAELERHRDRNPDDLSIGAWGFLEGNGFAPEQDPPVFRVAPSVEHAATAAALHQAYDSLSETGEGELAEIELSARAVRGARDLAGHLRRGLDPADALGRLAAKVIAAACRSETTPAIARAVPLRGDAEPVEAPARIDGLRLLELARNGTLGGLQVDFDSGRKELADVLGSTAEALVEALIEVSDGYARLCSAEGLHRVMNGRPEAAQAAFEALGGGGPPPQDFAVIDAIPGGHTLGSSVAVAALAVPAQAGTLDDVVPALAAIAGSLLPPLAGGITAGVETSDGLQEAHVDLAELGLTRLELAFAARPDKGRETALRPAVRLALAERGMQGSLRKLHLDRDAEDWWWAAARAAALMIEARPLFPDDIPGAPAADEGTRNAATDAARAAASEALGTSLQQAPAKFATAPEAAVRVLLRFGGARSAEPLSEALLAETPLDPEMATRLQEIVEAYLSQPAEERLTALLPGLPVPPHIPLSADSSRRDALLPTRMSAVEWIESCQAVQPALWPVADLLLAGADARLTVRAMQGATGIVRQDIPEGWVGGQVDPRDLSQSIDGLMLLSPKKIMDGQDICGLHLASWREVVAGPQTDIGVAARMPAPPARAPNALVLLTPPKEDGWEAETITGCLRHLRAQIKARGVDLQTLPGSSPPSAGEPPSDNLGLFLPLLWLPPAPIRDPEF